MKPRLPIIERPESIESIDPEVLLTVGDVLDKPNESATWHSNRLISPLNDRRTILKALSGLTERLCEYGSVSPQKISYDIDARIVEPHRSQRNIGWHIDGGEKSQTVALVASDLPTEFLVTGSKYDERRGSMKTQLRSRNLLYPEFINEDIQNDILAVYQPQPNEIVIINDHVHRSPYNLTDKPQSRVWVRAWLGF